MTTDEKREQRAMLLLEFQEAEENLAHLREKVNRYSAPIGEVEKWLHDAEIMLPSYDPEAAKRDANIRANIGLYQKTLNFEEILTLMNEIRDAKKLVSSLSTRKANLGLK